MGCIQSARCLDRLQELPVSRAYELCARCTIHSLEVLGSVVKHAQTVGEAGIDASRHSIDLCQSLAGAAGEDEREGLRELSSTALRAAEHGARALEAAAAASRLAAEVRDILAMLEASVSGGADPREVHAAGLDVVTSAVRQVTSQARGVAGLALEAAGLLGEVAGIAQRLTASSCGSGEDARNKGRRGSRRKSKDAAASKEGDEDGKDKKADNADGPKPD